MKHGLSVGVCTTYCDYLGAFVVLNGWNLVDVFFMKSYFNKYAIMQMTIETKMFSAIVQL